MVRAYIAIGSNIDPAVHVRAAIRYLARQTRVLGISTVYQSDALDRPEQPPYYNCIVEIDTGLPPLDLKRTILRPIEDGLGRVRGTDKYAARTIDLDLIAYGDVVMHTDGLTLPDPEISKRPFLAVPLAELAPDMALAGCNGPLAEIAARQPRDGLRPLPDYTRLLRRERV